MTSQTQFYADDSEKLCIHNVRKSADVGISQSPRIRDRNRVTKSMPPKISFFFPRFIDDKEENKPRAKKQLHHGWPLGA